MKNIFDWIKKNIILSFWVGLNNLKLNIIIAPVAIISTIVTYLIFRDSLAQNGFWVIFVPMFLTLLISLVYLIPKRNNSNYQIYYLFHLSKISKIVLLVTTMLMVGLYFFAQCQEYGLSVGMMCFQQIFGH